MTTLVAAAASRLGAMVSALTGRIEEVADLAALVAANALPQRMPAAFVLPLGFNGGPADAATGLYRQMLDEIVGVVLVAEALGDPKARKALAAIDTLVDGTLAGLAGWAPAGAIGVLVPQRGRLVSVNNGAVIYQIDFALKDQLRVAT